MSINPVFKLKQRMVENESDLKPPFNNKLIYEDNDWIAMAVGGSNSRKDYHFHERGSEFFYMAKGDMTLKIMTDNGPTVVSIKEGDIFLIPGGTIHSPQRPANSCSL